MPANKILDKLIKATIITMARLQTMGGRDKWPLPKYHIWDCDIYYASFLLQQLLDYFHKADQEGISEKDIAKIYKYPSYLTRMLFLFLFRPLSKLNYSEQVNLGSRIARILNIFWHGSFRANIWRKNILWSKERLKNKLKTLKFRKITKVDQLYRTWLSQIKGKLYLYTELIYNDMPNLGYEVHGPYNLGKRDLLISEYHDLRPIFWKFSKKFPFHKIIIYEIFRKIKVGIDIHGRLFSSKPLSLNIDKFTMIIDDKLVNDLKSLLKISQILDNFLDQGAKEKTQLKKSQIIEKFAFTRFLLLKPLAKRLKTRWLPPKWLFKKINKLYLNNKEKTYLKFLFSSKIGLKERFDPKIPIIFSQK